VVEIHGYVVEIHTPGVFAPYVVDESLELAPLAVAPY
jgi:hypothetical protein